VRLFCRRGSFGRPILRLLGCLCRAECRWFAPSTDDTRASRHLHLHDNGTHVVPDRAIGLYRRITASFHTLRVRHGDRIACFEPSRRVRFVQFDQHKRLASDFDSASRGRSLVRSQSGPPHKLAASARREPTVRGCVPPLPPFIHRLGMGRDRNMHSIAENRNTSESLAALGDARHLLNPGRMAFVESAPRASECS